MAFAPQSDLGSDRRWTVDEYMALDDDRRFELLNGELVMVPSPNIYHQNVVTQLGRLIDNHVERHDLGHCFDAPLDIVLSEETVLQPDFTYVRADRIEELYDGHGLTGAPDMVVEVLSQSTESRDRHRKRQLYAEAGVEWLLFVEPEGQVVEVLKLVDEGKYIVETTAAEDDVLNFELFPDLKIELADVWFEPPGGEDSDES